MTADSPGSPVREAARLRAAIAAASAALAAGPTPTRVYTQWLAWRAARYRALAATEWDRDPIQATLAAVAADADQTELNQLANGGGPDGSTRPVAADPRPNRTRTGRTRRGRHARAA